MKQTEDWLDAATAQIRFGPDRKAVRRELEAHLEDAQERYAAALTEKQAELAALEAMGDPEEVAKELGRLHKPWWGYLWRMSQIALVGAAALYCVVLVLLTASPVRSRLLPPRRLYRYLCWEGIEAAAGKNLVEEREISSGETVETSGYTIRSGQALLGRMNEDSPQWSLFIELNVNTGWPGDSLDWFALSGARIDAGTVTGVESSSVSWAFWQKILLQLESLPEEPEWVELDFGYGELRRTMHIDLTEEAGA